MLEHLDKNNLDSVQCRTGRDPYSGMGGGSSTASNNQGRQMNVQVQQGQHRQPKKQHQTQARQDGRGPQQGRDIFNMPLGQLSLREKLAVICKNYNSSEGCFCGKLWIQAPVQCQHWRGKAVFQPGTQRSKPRMMEE